MIDRDIFANQTYTADVTVNAGQDDMPAGMVKLFHLMYQGIGGVALKKKE